MRVFITWAHSGEDWPDERAELWKGQVEQFAELLESAGIDEVLLDLWVANERDTNWNTWGPNQIDEADYVLIMMNDPWAQRWSGRNNPKVGAGVVAEANALHGLFNEDQAEFQQKVRLVRLPSSTGDRIPRDLSGVKSLTVSSLTPEGIGDVLRDLNNEPRRIPSAGSPGTGSQAGALTGFRDGDMLLLRFRDFHAGVRTLEEHEKLIASNPGQGAWWGWWKKAVEGPQLPLWASFQDHLRGHRGLLGLFDTGSPAGVVTRALAVEVLPPRPNDFGDTPPFTPAPEQWPLVPQYYRPSDPTQTHSCAWLRLQTIDSHPCNFYGNYRFVSEDPQYAGVVITQPSQLTLSDQSLWHVRPVGS